MQLGTTFSNAGANNAWELNAMSMKILIVEDNEVVAECLQSILRAYGYDPILAATQEQAVQHCQHERDSIHALIADVMLDNAGGFETAQVLQRICPDMKVIFTSGYPLEHLVSTGRLPAHLGSALFLQKPFLADAVVSSLHCLDRMSKRQFENCGMRHA
jgi:DNA-binding NtrC family response regulator